MGYLLHADRFFLPQLTAGPGYLEIANGRFGRYYPEGSQPQERRVVEAQGQWLAPGLVDTHIHGFLGADVIHADWEEMERISRGLLKAGVTSWLPTTITAAPDRLLKICQVIGQHQGQESGAKIQGLHFEGPFFTPEHAGAENPKYMTPPNWQEFQAWQQAAGGKIKKISLAPELPGSCDFIRRAINSDVVVALGHSSASYQEAQAAVLAGASLFTHVFNGMPAISHHQPTITNAALTLAESSCEMIADGHHLDQSTVKLVLAAKGYEHVALITDCMEAGGMPDGDYHLGELAVVVKAGQARLKANGNLAGSILELKTAVKNLVDWNLATPAQAIKMASLIPAKTAKIDQQCGAILPGRSADFILLTPDLELRATYLNGQKRYQA
jgi:N-acetylglucosamine-6-phosphate deacetylase